MSEEIRIWILWILFAIAVVGVIVGIYYGIRAAVGVTTNPNGTGGTTKVGFRNY
jgi:hypothetical protein